MKKIATWMLVFFGLAAWCSAAEVNGTQMCPRPKDTESTEVRVPTNTSEHKKPQTDNPTTTSPTDERRDAPKEEDDHPILTVLFEQVLPDLIDILIHPENHGIEEWVGPGPHEDDRPNHNTDTTAGPPIVTDNRTQDGPTADTDHRGETHDRQPREENTNGPQEKQPTRDDTRPTQTKESPLEQALSYLIDAGLGEGTTVGELKLALEDMIAGKYDGNLPSAEDIIRSALEGGLVGGSDGGSAGDTSNLPSIGGCFGGDGENDSGTSDPWSTLLDKALDKAKTTTLKKLESWTTKQLDAWINKHPTVQKWFSILGINANGIVNGVKNIWGVLTGNGTLSEKFAQLASMAQNALCDMASNALKYGLDKLGQWLSGIAQKWIDKAVNWLKGKLDKFFGGKIKIPDKLLAKFQSQLNKLVGRGIGKAVDWAKSKGEEIINGMRPDGSNPQGGGGGVTEVGGW